MTTRTITGLFTSYDEAERTVRDIEASGIPHSAISIVANNSDHRYTLTGEGGPSKATKGAQAGATFGGVAGGGTGLLAGLGMLAIPGVGPVIAAGWLVAAAVGAAAGAAVGGAAGGIVGSLTRAGVNEKHAHVYAEGVRRGGTLVTARADDARASTAREILLRYKSVDPVVRGAAYGESGWSSFNENAPAYTADQVAAERVRYIGQRGI